MPAFTDHGKRAKADGGRAALGGGDAVGSDIRLHDPLGNSGNQLEHRKTLTRRQPNIARIGDRVQRDEIDYSCLQNGPQTLVGCLLPLDVASRSVSGVQVFVFIKLEHVKIGARPRYVTRICHEDNSPSRDKIFSLNLFCRPQGLRFTKCAVGKE